MIPTGTPCPGCGDQCTDCGQRMCTTNGPAPIPTCPDHPTCIRCALAHPVVYCTECQRVAIEGRTA